MADCWGAILGDDRVLFDSPQMTLDKLLMTSLTSSLSAGPQLPLKFYDDSSFFSDFFHGQHKSCSVSCCLTGIIKQKLHC